MMKKVSMALVARVVLIGMMAGQLAGSAAAVTELSYNDHVLWRADNDAAHYGTEGFEIRTSEQQSMLMYADATTMWADNYQTVYYNYNNNGVGYYAIRRTNAGDPVLLFDHAGQGTLYYRLTSNGITNSTGMTNTGGINTDTINISGNATIGGKLTVSQLVLSGGGGGLTSDTLAVTGASTFGGATQINNTLNVTGLITGTGGLNLENFTVADGTGNTVIGGTLSSAGSSTLGTGAGTTNTLGSGANSTNTIGNAGTSTNTMTGATNTLTATTSNSFYAPINYMGNAPTYAAATQGILVDSDAGISMKGTNNSLTATAGNRIVAGESNTLVAPTNLIGNAATWAAANTAMRIDSATRTTDIKTQTFNLNTDASLGATANNIGSTAVGTTITGLAGNSRLAMADSNVWMGVNQGTPALGGRFTVVAAATGATVGMTAGDVGARSGIANGVTTYGAAQTVNVANLDNGTDASRAIVSGATYVNRLQGNTLVDGNMYINGTLVYTASTVAQTQVTDGASILTGATTTTVGATTIVNKNEVTPHAIVDGNGAITINNGAASQASASLTLKNGIGNTHGVVITEDKMVMSGGVHSTSLRLDDGGATFSNSATGAPVRVTGVADGASDFDAVNYRQLRRAHAGIAAVSAMSSIPSAVDGKRAALGIGYGYFEGENAIAAGLRARVTDNVSFNASFGAGGIGRNARNYAYTANAGWSLSFGN
jgi:hypothetical protein